MTSTKRISSIHIFIGLLPALIWSGCVRERCPSYANELVTSRIWKGYDSTADDFGEQVHDKLVELVSLTKPEFDTYIQSTGLSQVDSGEMSTHYVGVEEMVSYLYKKTPYWTMRLFQYRSNAKKPYRALKKYLASRPDLEYTTENPYGRYTVDRFTDGYKEFAVQHSPEYCFYFISYKETEEHNYFLNCWQLANSSGTPDSLLTFVPCSSENVTFTRPHRTLHLKERGVVKYSRSIGKGESQILQGKWSFNDQVFLRIYNNQQQLEMSFRLVDIDKDQMQVIAIMK